MPFFDGKFKDRIQSRLEGRGTKRFGRGNLLSKVQNRADKISTRVKGRKPDIIPTVSETLGKWNVGSRITEMLPVTPKRRAKTKSSPQVAKQSGADISL